MPKVQLTGRIPLCWSRHFFLTGGRNHHHIHQYSFCL